MMHLAGYPRVRLGHFPTPLEPLPNLTRYLGGPSLYIKRDDCTGLATGGNKTRKLEFLVADALAQGADMLITQGAVQSNHVRQTIAAAARYGLQCKVLLEDRHPQADEDYRESGNVMLDLLLGGDIAARLPAGTPMQQAMDELAAQMREQGNKPYVIPGGGSNPVGALGYVACAQELITQTFDLGLHVDALIHATGSAGTQAGLVTGLAASNSGIPVIGVSVRADRAAQEETVWELTQATRDHLGLAQTSVRREDIVVDDGYVGAGYGMASDGMVEAVRLVAELEGILLDPVYSGKAMAGLIAQIRAGRYTEDQNIVFLHTGGAVALFAYRSVFNKAAVQAA
ncbi:MULTISPECIES: D-cysteine desulfhydrase [unclassified Achromobacter]|uniref:D-cysteine desulfhydrase n=1 Tax=unclassified Achromobacter TaxID=2626865 RepID=UPI000B517B3B|nr:MULTISPECIES: D-cysteine desulfhydrase [unclassified Achromobacter]OWT81087.1 D-cysteine desulfhydrase [Achromobacter sp. HZ34]OWT82588.1 D-cysteine desulfhydrase [Achromobacter sp. HZ28]